MHLISALASGVNGAANGTALLLARGSNMPVVYYKDFEATQSVQTTLSGVALDANGSLVAYVNQLTDVKVLDVNGAVLREFVSADNATAVEVINPSFTGVDYVTGASGANKPTTLDAILSLLIGSTGTTNFNVLVGGVPVTLQAAVAGLAGLFFNVKSYGAVGDGVADDGAAISTAIAAAAAAGAAGANGGTVFFPPGKYRSTTVITVTAGVSLLGAGANCSQLLWDSAVIANGLVLPAGGSIGTVAGLRFDSVNTVFANPLVLHSGGTWSVLDCVFGGGATTHGILLTSSLVNLTSSLQLNVERCQFTTNADSSLVTQSGSCRMNFHYCTFTLYAGAYSHNVVDVRDNVNIDGCRFDGSPATSGSAVYIKYAPSGTGACVFSNNNFRANVNFTAQCMNNANATPTLDCIEYGNVFGDPVSGLPVNPYAGSLGFFTFGALTFGSHHGSRIGRVQAVNSNAAVGFNSDQFEACVVNRTTAAAQTISFVTGRIGDTATLQVINSGGGAITITLVGCSIAGGGATFVVNNGITSLRRFRYSWAPALATSVWMQESAESLDN